MKTSDPIAHVDLAVQRLQGALYGSIHLGPEHPAVGESLRCAHGALTDALRTRPTLRVLFFTDRVVSDDRTLPCSQTVVRALGDRLRAMDCDALVFRAGLTLQDLERLVGAVRAVPGDAARQRDLGHVTLGRIATGAAPPSPQAVRPVDAPPPPEIPEQVRAALASVERRERMEVERFESALQTILAYSVAMPTAMLQLARVGSHSEYTLAHTVNVAILASALAESVGLSGTPLEHLTSAALLHDVGKLHIPDAVLNKNGALNPEERAAMERHPGVGASLLLDRRDVPRLAIIVAYEHHRRIDGGGYPARHCTGRPNLASQIVQIADIFDALRTNRPYRAALSREESLKILDGLAGKSFDRALFEVFAEDVVRRVVAPLDAPAVAPAPSDAGGQAPEERPASGMSAAA